MRILIDSTQIPLGRTGVGIYAEQLIDKLGSILQPQDTLYVLIQDDDQSLRRIIAAHDKIVPLFIPSSIFRNRALLAFYEQCILPLKLRSLRIHIVHSLHYTFPLISPCARAVTIHDLTYFLWPQMHTTARKIVMANFTKLALRHAEAVLFVSQATRNDAERLFGPGKNLRAVTPLAVDQQAFEQISPATIADTLGRLRIATPYILFLGTLEPRKNIARLIHAFNQLGPEHSRYHLVIAGRPGWQFQPILDSIEGSPVKDRIHRLGYVSAADKPALIAGCDLLVYPSLYEGFGLPVLEAMAAGAPVITSAVSSLPEVAGTAAVLVDPASVEQIASAIDSVLSNESYRNRLREAGRQQAHKFSWETTARLTYAAYAALNARKSK